VFLSGPSAGFDVVDTGNVRSPACLAGNLVEFAVLDHHRVYDSKKALITWEDSRTPGKCVTYFIIRILQLHLIDSQLYPA
jgi:hypothetical protein